MKTLSELLQERDRLPRGEIYQKKINGKSYYYYQYFENGKSYTRIVNKNELEELSNNIRLRKQIEKEIKHYRSRDKEIVLSKNAYQLTGEVMSDNTPVAKFDSGVLVNINENLAPLIIKRTHSLEQFLKLRVIDMSRTNARILKKALNIQVDEPYKIALYAYALSISDNYWFKPKHSKIVYQDIKFNNDNYYDMALKGDVTLFQHKTKLTPEITATGSFEKGWKLIKNHWWLYKSGTDKQIFSELCSYEVAKLLKINTAIYEYDNGYIRSLNFAEDYNFEPIASLAGDDDNYDTVFNILYDINKKIAKDYLKLIMFDSVINNIDRHNENAGLLRDRKTGRIVSLAPNFDNNLALLSNSEFLSKDVKKDGFIKVFVKFLTNNEKAKALYKEIDFVSLNKEELITAVNNIPISIDNKEELITAILIRYNYLKSLF